MTQSVNCLYFPSECHLPLSQILDNDNQSLEEYMSELITRISLTDEQSRTCRLMVTTIKNGDRVYIDNHHGNFINELMIWLNDWSRITDNKKVNIILNLALDANIHRLLKDDELLVKPLFRIVRWMGDRGINLVIGLPLSYAFYPLQYDIHIINEYHNFRNTTPNMIILLRSWISKDKITIINSGRLIVRLRPDNNDIHTSNQLITNLFRSKMIRSDDRKRLLRFYKRKLC